MYTSHVCMHVYANPDHIVLNNADGYTSAAEFCVCVCVYVYMYTCIYMYYGVQKR